MLPPFPDSIQVTTTLAQRAIFESGRDELAEGIRLIRRLSPYMQVVPDKEELFRKMEEQDWAAAAWLFEPYAPFPAETSLSALSSDSVTSMVFDYPARRSDYVGKRGIYFPRGASNAEGAIKLLSQLTSSRLATVVNYGIPERHCQYSAEMELSWVDGFDIDQFRQGPFGALCVGDIPVLFHRTVPHELRNLALGEMGISLRESRITDVIFDSDPVKDMIAIYNSWEHAQDFRHMISDISKSPLAAIAEYETKYKDVFTVIAKEAQRQIDQNDE